MKWSEEGWNADKTEVKWIRVKTAVICCSGGLMDHRFSLLTTLQISYSEATRGDKEW